MFKWLRNLRAKKVEPEVDRPRYRVTYNPLSARWVVEAFIRDRVLAVNYWRTLTDRSTKEEAVKVVEELMAGPEQILFYKEKPLDVR